MINNYMRPMTASGAGPAGPDLGGMVMQGINAWQGMKRADMEAARHQAMIEALKGGGFGNMWGGGQPPAGGLGSMSMPAEGTAMGSYGGGVPPVY